MLLLEAEILQPSSARPTSSITMIAFLWGFEVHFSLDISCQFASSMVMAMIVTVIMVIVVVMMDLLG